MTTANPHPLDFDAIHKGSVVHVAEVEAAIGVRSDDAAYALKALGLAQRIESEMAERGEPATVVVRHLALHVLTDEEASTYNETSFERAVRRLGRSHRRMMSVDVGKLSAARRQSHEIQTFAQARQLLALRKARKDLLKPHEDNRPSLADGR